LRELTAHHDAEGGYFLSSSEHTPLSPELALIDPEIAASALAVAPEPRIVAPVRPVTRRRRRRRLAVPRDLKVALAGLLAGLAVGVLVTRLGAPTSTASAGVAPVRPAATTIRVGRPVTIRWAPKPSSSYFDVVLRRDGRRVLDAWPLGQKFALPAAWRYRGKRYKLGPGRYAWYVYPGVGARADGRYGGLLASGRFTIAR
jgi:hypothetical protein